MPAEKRNNFLDAGDSDGDDNGYNSEEEVRKGNVKRRRIQSDDDLSDGEDNAASVDDDVATRDPRFQLDVSEGAPEDVSDVEEDNTQHKKQSLDDLPGVTRPLTKKNLVATEAAIKKSGVIYISRVPPCKLNLTLGSPLFTTNRIAVMKPQKLRSLLEPYGTINRIFLSPEDPTARSRRIKNGGNKKRSFTDGWVEFIKKKDAKAAVDLLNGHVIGGKKGSFYRDDMWSISYLKGFKWRKCYLLFFRMF